MNDSIPQVRNIGDLRRLLQQYDGMLSPENRRLISSLIGELENGGDPQALANLAGADAAKRLSPAPENRRYGRACRGRARRGTAKRR
ncbi:MAG: hypothetical protein K6B40_05495 [Firmicutes bacterium]|nr:hypothetical protein [Bacillota bacterium]